jgi:ATP-dependent protease Clp ATPase subunit
MSKLICDFCGATDTKDNPVITGDNACICRACINAAHEIMNGNFVEENKQDKKKEQREKEITILLESLKLKIKKISTKEYIYGIAISLFLSMWESF